MCVCACALLFGTIWWSVLINVNDIFTDDYVCHCFKEKCTIYVGKDMVTMHYLIDWLQSLKQFFIKMSYHILVASLTLMALF